MIYNGYQHYVVSLLTAVPDGEALSVQSCYHGYQHYIELLLTEVPDGEVVRVG